MTLNRRTVLKAGGVLALAVGVAGCQSVLPGSARSEANLVVTNKSSAEKTITLAVSTDETSSNWKNEFTLGAGETRKAVQEGGTPMSHDVISNATYHIEVHVTDGPNDTWQWESAKGTMFIEVYEDRIKHWTDEDA